MDNNINKDPADTGIGQTPALEKLFVYGTLKAGQGNHHNIAGAKLLGTAETAEKFAFMQNGAYPAICKMARMVAVKGEVYEVTPAQLSACDVLEGHPHFYVREKTNVWITDPVRKNERCETVWVYFIKNPPTANNWMINSIGTWPLPSTVKVVKSGKADDKPSVNN